MRSSKTILGNGSEKARESKSIFGLSDIFVVLKRNRHAFSKGSLKDVTCRAHGGAVLVLKKRWPYLGGLKFQLTVGKKILSVTKRGSIWQMQEEVRLTTSRRLLNSGAERSNL